MIVKFRSKYDKWTMISMKATLRECEDSISVLELNLSKVEREERKAIILKLREEHHIRKNIIVCKKQYVSQINKIMFSLIQINLSVNIINI